MRALTSRSPLHFVLRALILLRHRPRLVLAFLLCLQVLHGTWGINQDVIWGHAGFHIGEYGTQAVHLRRHHAFIPAESDEFTKPRNSDLELRHPFLLHPYIAVMQAAFGERPWTARVVPLLFSLLALGGMWSLVRRTRDDLTAHLATALFVLSPLNLIYSILPEYQISAVAWTLWAWVGVHETLKKPTGRSIALWLGGAALAGLTDWPWFEVAAFFFVLIAWRLRPGGPLARSATPRDLRAMRLALFGFCVVVLATFVQHFVIVKALGQADALRHSFNDRTTVFNWAEARNMIKTRFPLLHTTPVLWATGAWLLSAVLFWRRDLATALFLSIFLGYTLDMKLFFSGHAFHEYRNSYWYVPVFAYATADVTLGVARWLGRRFRSLREAVLVPVIAALAASIGLSTVAVDRLKLGRVRGGSVTMDGHDPHVSDFTMARVVHHFSRGRKVFLGDGMGARDEMTWLLEAPHEHLSSVLPLQQAIEQRRPFVVLDRLGALRGYPEWAAIARQGQVFILDSSAMIVWTPGTPPSLETARLAYIPRGRLDAWLHAEAMEPVLAPGQVSDAVAVANDIGAPPEVLTQIQRGERPLLRLVPRNVRSRGTR